MILKKKEYNFHSSKSDVRHKKDNRKYYNDENNKS